MYRLRLYVAGLGPAVERQIAGVRSLLDAACGGGYELAVCDILEHPLQAQEDTIYATPTLLRLRPPPTARVVGDLSDPQRVVKGLVLAGNGG
jgi:circadian clock protein KaiB